MPIIRKDQGIDQYVEREQENITKENLTADIELITCDTLVISKDIASNSVEVDVGGSQTSDKLIYSESFGPCQAVLARASDGSFIVFHATNPFQGRDLDHFAQLIHGKKIDEIYVFMKPTGPHHYLCMKYPQEFQNHPHLKGVAVNLIPTHKYTAITADPTTGRVFLTKELVVCNPRKAQRLANEETCRINRHTQKETAPSHLQMNTLVKSAQGDPLLLYSMLNRYTPVDHSSAPKVEPSV
ncbi:hypothetical protein [Piscirickettsia litoralis]|uniref:Uncharacterized protein n=1 Tax=Piscirickettsia litoralis TaxID=1891921 RepID=A0ABX3A3K2_9GAMM|nr:hypothetical protein [Piscirickettsia litoralis]ODN43451.1 hypothetical protein BGC07_11640 [Piscirickettsia litoralis]